MKTHLIAAALSAFALFAAPVSLAQDQPTVPAPPVSAEPAAPATTPAPTTPPPAASTPAPSSEAEGDAASPDDGKAACHTARAAGEQCSCLSAPTDFGTSRANSEGGGNVCVVPN